MIASLIAAAAAGAVAVFCCGAGHGTYLPAKLLFPLTMISTGYLDTITTWFAILGLAQFPLYGMLLSIGLRKNRGKITLMAIGVWHLLAICAALIFSSPHFPN